MCQLLHWRYPNTYLLRRSLPTLEMGLKDIINIIISKKLKPQTSWCHQNVSMLPSINRTGQR